MKIGMIGIGDIAKKAYLPVLTKRKELDIILCSRNETLLKEMAQIYRGNRYVTSLQDLISAHVDAAFVHAATSAHYDICRELLKNGIPVYVDKPISYLIEEARQLFDLAKRNNIILRVGFNRREAPLIEDMKNLEKPDVVIYQKNRVFLPADIRGYIFDDFIHVADSIRYLLDDQIVDYHVTGKVIDNLLYSVTVQLVGRRGTAIGIMNRESGKTEEHVEFICPGEKRIVEDLNTLTVYKNGVETREKFGDWEPVLFRRGFNQITDRFIQDVSEGNGFMEKDEDSLLTHELCEEIVQRLIAGTKEGPLPILS